MKSLFSTIVLIGLLPLLAFAEGKNFGEKISLKNSIDFKAAVANFKKYGDKDILVSGKVDKVCQSKGCWMALHTDKEPVRVTFKDYGFFVPKDSMGKKVLAQGKLVEHISSVQEQRHLLRDAGASDKEVAAVKAEKKVFRFVATGVTIL